MNNESKQVEQVKQRIDYGKVLILGQSGSGKTFMAKTADKTTTGFINLSRKPLSFKGEFKYHGKPKNWGSFIKNLSDYISHTEIDTIIVDDITMAFDNLLQDAQKNFKGYDVFSHFNKQIPDFLDLIRDAKKDIIVTGHDEVLLIEGYKQKRAKVHGKQFEGLMERYFSTVLYAGSRLKDSKPEYFLTSFDPDTSAKAPEGLFPGIEIKNDATYIFERVADYYSK